MGTISQAHSYVSSPVMGLEVNLSQATALTQVTDLSLHVSGLMKIRASSQVSVPQETQKYLMLWWVRVVLPAMEPGGKEDTSLISVGGGAGRMEGRIRESKCFLLL